jgi:8-oxo-dGTP diphosphatase
MSRPDSDLNRGRNPNRGPGPDAAKTEILPITPVAIALVRHGDCFLVGRRAPGRPLAGFYEFPGGKCHPGEPPEACVVRECREETGLRIEAISLRRQVVHRYPYGTVHLHFFDCRLERGANTEPLLNSFEWVPKARLPDLQFPDPNMPLIAELVATLDG